MDNNINLWLQKFKVINKVAQTIHTEQLDTKKKNLAMQRAGYEELKKRHTTDRGWFRQYQYVLLLKSQSESDKQRLHNNDWLDELSDELAKANEEQNLPILEDGKICTKVSSANAITFEQSEDGSESIYSLQLYFEIKGGM